MNLIKKSRLYFQQGNSDKVYEIDLCELSNQQDNRYLVNFRYGRRGQKLREGTKTPDAVNLQKAQQLFNSVLLSKTNKGYIDHQNSENTSIQSDSKETQSSATESIIHSLINNIQKQKDSKKRARIIWRMGEIGLPLFLPEVIKLIGKGHWLEDYSIAWMIGRCGSIDQINNIEKLLNSKHDTVKHIALEAFLKLTPESSYTHYLKDDLNSIPDEIEDHLTLDTDQLCLHLITWYQQSSMDDTDKGDLLAVLYRLSYQYPKLRFALIKLINVIPFKPGLFRGIRRVFKAAEFRQDSKLFAALCFRFETTSEYFYYEWDWYYLPGSGSIKPSKELKSPDSKLAYSQKTRNYFRRRCWRNLRRMGELEKIFNDNNDSNAMSCNESKYVDFATEILLTMSDSLAAKPKRSEYYTYTANWTRELNSVNEYGPFAAFWSFNHIIYANSENYFSSKNAKAWRHTGTEDHTNRTEKYPDLWQQQPQNTLRLLLESECHPVHKFASRVFLDQTEYYSEITIEQLIILLEKKYSETNLLALEIVKQRLIDLPYDGSLFFALFNSALTDARELAQSEISRYQQEWSKDLDFISQILFIEHKDVIDWQQAHFSNLNFVSSDQEILLEKLVQFAFKSHLQQSQFSPIIEFIKQKLSTAVNNLPMALIEKMMNSEQVSLQSFAVELLLINKLSLDKIPTNIYQKITGSSFTEVRALGIKLIGKQSDKQLLNHSTLLLSIFKNGESLERQSAGQLILRLAKSSKEYAKSALSELLNLVFCAEQKQGQHQDLEDLIGTQFQEFHHLVDDNQLWRLLQAKSRCAQRVGSSMLQSRDPKVFSVRQWALLGSHNEQIVRLWVEKAYKNNFEHIKKKPLEALRILDSDWLDCREFAFDYFREHFDDQQWQSESIIFVVDNNHDDVQAFGREILQSYFDEDQGAEYLTKLSQHPTENVQLFASNFLEDYASNDIERIEQLKFYFISVLSQVNKARICKDRVIKFLMTEAEKHEAVARLVFELFNRQSVTIVIKDKSKLIQSLLKLKQQYPFLAGPLRLLEKPIWQAKEIT